MSRFKESEAMRQKVLDYVNANPGIDAPAIIRHLGCLKNTGSSLLKRMADGDEIRREPVVMEGPCSSFQTFRCWANVTTPIGTKQVRKNIERKISQGELVRDSYAKGKPNRNLPAGMRVTHTNDSSAKKPTKCPDAMGSNGMAFGIQSSCTMI